MNLNAPRFSILAITLALTLLCCKTQGPVTEFNQDSNDEVSEEIQEEYVGKDLLLYNDKIYKPSIKTVQMYNSGVNELSSPIYEVGSENPLICSFDDLTDDSKNYYYTLIHCNADWEPSGLIEPEFMDGFYPDLITNYQRSFNTIIDYIRYEVTIPNENLTIKKSGNYILYIYEDNKDSPVLTRRFMVNENIVGIDPSVKRSSVVEYRKFKNEVDLNVHLKNFQVSDPFRDITVVLKQNGRWDNAITDLKPKFVRNNVLEYNHERVNEFWGGNEFRKIDMKSARYQTQEIKAFKREEDGVHAYLNLEKSRSFKQYLFEYDINGRYLIKNDDGFDDKLEPEYIYVHFQLKKADPVENGDVYIFGQLSDWQAKSEMKMKYNEETLIYSATLLLKQGYYNYLFATLEDGKSTVDMIPIEGSHSETINDYGVFVYSRDRSLDYDRLIGIKQFTTNNF